MWRSILAVVVGGVTSGALAMVGDAATQVVAEGAFDVRGITLSVPVLLLMVVYITVFCGIGGWVAAAVARRGDLRPVWALAILQVIANLAVNATFYDSRLIWFYALLLLLIPVATVTGGWRRVRPSADKPA